MDYHTFHLVSQYLHSNSYIFYALISKDGKDIINSIRKDNKYETKYNVLISKSLLCYSHDILNLVYHEKVIETLFKIGDLDSIKYLHTKTDIIDDIYLDISAEYGHLDIMKWLRANGCPFEYEPFSYNTFEHAVINGNLVNMKWLLEIGCPFGENAFPYAAENGNLENMKWLLENGCPFGKATFHSAVINGNQDNIDWLIANGCPQN